MPTLHNSLPRISPCRWFDDQAKQAAQCYASIFLKGGPQDAQQGGWRKDRFGASWHIVPRTLEAMMSNGNRVMTAMLGMKKRDRAKLQSAFGG